MIAFGGRMSRIQDLILMSVSAVMNIKYLIWPFKKINDRNDRTI
jgi:hypothetical protein